MTAPREAPAIARQGTQITFRRMGAFALVFVMPRGAWSSHRHILMYMANVTMTFPSGTRSTVRLASMTPTQELSRRSRQNRYK